MSADRIGVTVVVVSRNEAVLLDDCLTRVSWCDDIVVLDMQSEDRTKEVAVAHGARVISVPLRPIAEQVRQVGLDAARHRWVLQLDPDETAPPRIDTELHRVLSARPEAAAVRWPFAEHAFGHPVPHLLGGAAKVVAVHTGRVRYHAAMGAHEEPDLGGPVVDAADFDVEPINHHAYRNVRQVAEKMVRYGSTGSGFEGGLDHANMALARLLVRYLVRREAWRDGATGVQVGSLLAIQDYVGILIRRERAGQLDVPLSPAVQSALAVSSRISSGAIAILRHLRRR
jgi:glycosyltransferase involved in cell wall biosynthesis